jgi:hypothetical protein
MTTLPAADRANVDRCPYSEGVASHSPGLPRLAATLGERPQLDLYPEGVAAFDNAEEATPLG